MAPIQADGHRNPTEVENSEQYLLIVMVISSGTALVTNMPCPFFGLTQTAAQ